MPCGACRTIQPRTQAVGTVRPQRRGAAPPRRAPAHSYAQVFGKYVGTWTSPGLYYINPCGFEVSWMLREE
jgi:hypothetical protein